MCWSDWTSWNLKGSWWFLFKCESKFFSSNSRCVWYFSFCSGLSWNDHQSQLAKYIQYRVLPEGWTPRMWSRYTGILIWNAQNPWTGLRGQFYDHLLDQTVGFYGCCCAVEPIHVQLNLATYFIEVITNFYTNKCYNLWVWIGFWNSMNI